MAESAPEDAPEQQPEQEQMPPGAHRVNPERMVLKLSQRVAGMAQENAGLQVLAEELSEALAERDEIIADLRASLVAATSTGRGVTPRSQKRSPKAAAKP